MKKLPGYFLSVILVLFSLIIIDALVVGFVNYKTKGTEYLLSIKNISDRIEVKNGEYIVSTDTYVMLDQAQAFAMIIDDYGDVIWSYNKPDDIPSKYGLKDVVSFSRWYLNDYPVYTRIRDEGILVAGVPKDSVWKYVMEYRLETLQVFIKILPYIFLSNLIILIMLPIIITRHRMKAREYTRTEWIAGVSHDIRTPLSIVMGSVEKGDIIEKQCLRIRDLIGNLNTENKLESGTGKWNNEKIMLTPLLREIVCDYINTYEEQYTFNLDIDEDLEDAYVYADILLIRRMLDNLINNSISHNEDGCEITVSLQSNYKNKPLLTISDDGQGVNDKTIRRLNTRVKSDYLPEHGLGIRVVKQVAKKYHYKILFSSKPEEFFKCEILLK